MVVRRDQPRREHPVAHLRAGQQDKVEPAHHGPEADRAIARTMRDPHIFEIGQPEAVAQQQRRRLRHHQHVERDERRQIFAQRGDAPERRHEAQRTVKRRRDRADLQPHEPHLCGCRRAEQRADLHLLRGGGRQHHRLDIGKAHDLADHRGGVADLVQRIVVEKKADPHAAARWRKAITASAARVAAPGLVSPRLAAAITSCRAR